MSGGPRLDRVLHVAHSAAPEGSGGIEAYLKEILPAQRASGVDARLFVGSVEHRAELDCVETEIEGVPAWRVHRDDYFFDHFAKQLHPGALQQFRRVLAEFRPQVVHVHQWLRTSAELCATAADHGIPVVVTLHDLYSSCPRCFRVRPGEIHCERVLSIESCLDCVPRYGHESEPELRASIDVYRDHSRAELASANAVLVASKATRDLIGHGLGLPPETFQVLPLTYRPRFDSTGRERSSGSETDSEAPVRFGYWGSLTYRKGIPVLLDAFARICQELGPDRLELHLFGRIDTEQLRTQLEGLADGLPVRFHGRFDYDDLPAAELDVAVFPMVCFETWGFVLDEAFELGLPVVLTDLGAMPERAQDAALRVPPSDPEALAEAMRRLVAEPELRARLKSQIPHATSSLDEHLDRLATIYGLAADEGARPASRIGAERWLELLRLQRESAQLRSMEQGGADGGPR